MKLSGGRQTRRRTVRAFGVALLVLVAHGLLLRGDGLRPQKRPLPPESVLMLSMLETSASGGGLTLGRPAPAFAAGRVAPASIPRPAQTQTQTQASTPQSRLLVASAPEMPQVTAPSLPSGSPPAPGLRSPIAAPGFSQLDFELAQIEGSTVQFGAVALQFSLQDGGYASALEWQMADLRGQIEAQGALEGPVAEPAVAPDESTDTDAMLRRIFDPGPQSVLWQLRGAVAAMNLEPLQSGSGPLPLDMPGAVLHWQATRMESLVLPAGRLWTVELVGMSEGVDARQLTVWCAPALAWVPVRIRLQQANGAVLDVLLKRMPEVQA